MKPLHCLTSVLIFVATSAISGEVKTEDAALKLAIGAIHKFHLTTLKDECGVAYVIDKPSYFDVVVREHHTPTCGGTPETAPRLFTVRVRKHDGRLTSDVYEALLHK